MMPAWYLRMSQRERALALIIAAALFLLANVLVWSFLSGALTRARSELAALKSTRAQQGVFLKESSMWTKREAWLKRRQPALKSPVEASTLLDDVKQIAGKHKILIENPAIGTGDSTPHHRAVSVSIETKSAWPPLVRFLYDVQQPESFVVFENVTLAIDPSDPTMMRGKFKIARWFAPTQAKN